MVPGGQNPGMKKAYQSQVQTSSLNTSNNQQMSIMTKYNKQHMFKQGKMTAQDTRERGVASNGNGGSGPPRHNSAPREAAYAPMDDDELRRQHLLNQSVDMSQMNGPGSAALASANQSGKQSQNIQKLNLGKLGQSIGNAGKSIKSVQHQKQHHGQSSGHAAYQSQQKNPRGYQWNSYQYGVSSTVPGYSPTHGTGNPGSSHQRYQSSGNANINYLQ